MASSDKITILLADEDALRRDGLAAVLQGTPHFEVIAQCPDGEAAMNQIRQLQPDVAVVDLNLPKLHGIELVRRVRGEQLGTKIVILAGTTDDDIIREVVRAGGDAYLLKNGPARHLIDAISYVRDGGQYFSPQLRRDGRDRHLLEEPPRVSPAGAARGPARDPEEDTADRDRNDERRDSDGESEDAGRSAPPRSARDNRAARPQRPAARENRRSGDPQRLRERLREDHQADNLEERDYEILGMMAEGIRPILDRLDEIDSRIGEMETGESPVPGNVRGWLNNEMADTFGDSRSPGKDLALGRTLNDLEARLPQLIEEAVTTRFHNMANKLQQDVEETHVRTLETFVKNIQVKLVQRVSALETDMSKQAEAMNELREYSLRTEDNLGRLISGVDKLAQELPKRLAAPAPPTESEPEPEPERGRRKLSRKMVPVIFWISVAVLVTAGIVIKVETTWLNFGVDESAPTPIADASGKSSPNSTGSGPGGAASGKLVAPPANADTKTRLQAAQEYTERKDYSMAEYIYKQVLKAEPNNVDALKALASVLYREDKIEESAAILDKLPKTN
jgi:DNA-binding NarL/FixJ family response regulator